MKITMYELLGMIKDGKAPKEIEYEGYLLIWDNVDKDYYCEEYGNLFEYLFCEFQTIELLNFTVEILEEEKKIPEKLDYCEENTFKNKKETTYLSSEERRLLDSNFKEIGNKINSIIDYLKSKGE